MSPTPGKLVSDLTSYIRSPHSLFRYGLSESQDSLLSIPTGTNLSVGGYSVGTRRPSLTILCFQVPKRNTTGQLGNGRNIWRRLWEQFHHFIIKAFSPREVFYQSSNDEIR